MEKPRAPPADPCPLSEADGCSPRAGPQTPAEAGAGSYRFSLDVAGFSPEELSVTVEGRRLRVRAQRRRRTEGADGRLSHEFRELRKDLLLPDDAVVDALACTLAGTRLCLEAPRGTPAAVCGAPVGERKAAQPPNPGSTAAP